MHCIYCGRQLSKSDSECGCGYRVPSVTDFDNHPYYDRPDGFSLTSFIGPNADSMFINMHSGMPKLNWHAALLGPFYYVYRKCWNGIIINFIGLALSASLLWFVGLKFFGISEIVLEVLFALLYFLHFGLLFYPTYKAKYRHLYTKYQYTLHNIPRLGGVSLNYVILTLLGILAILIVVGILII